MAAAAARGGARPGARPQPEHARPHQHHHGAGPRQVSRHWWRETVLSSDWSRNIPIVVDADGLWHLATNPGLLQVVPQKVPSEANPLSHLRHY